MRANKGSTYALIHRGIVQQVFTAETMSQWHDDLDVRDITVLDPQPQVGWLYIDGALVDPATTPEGIAAVEAARKAATDQTRDAKIFGGVEFNGHVFDTDARSVMNLTGTLAAVAAGAFQLPRPFYWRSRDNVNVDMTLDDLKGLAAAMIAVGYQAYLQAWAAKDALATTEETKT